MFRTKIRSLHAAMMFAVAGVCTLSAARPCDAGISVVSTERSVLTANGYADKFTMHSTAAAGPFQAEASTVVPFESGPGLTDFNISQTSRVGPGGVTASGTIRAETGDNASRYRSLVDVTFDVAEPTPYTLDSALTFSSVGRVYGSNQNEPYIYLLSLTRTGQEATPVAGKIFTQTDNFSGVGTPSVDAAGTLAPGQYHLLFDVRADFNQSADVGEYKLSFETGDAGGNPANAVPLPPAAWAGGATLAGLAVTRWRAVSLASRG